MAFGAYTCACLLGRSGSEITRETICICSTLVDNSKQLFQMFVAFELPQVEQGSTSWTTFLLKFAILTFSFNSFGVYPIAFFI